jgi:exodeoxyribonuclease VII large subunit
MPGQDFFDFRENLATGRVPKRAPQPKPQALTVSQLTAMIDGALRKGLPQAVLVRGEISNVNLHRASGHLYFTLKDSSNCIDCVMWHSDLARLKFKPIDGTELLASGRVGVYGPRGRYQLYVSTLNPIGQGALELAFQQLRAKLAAEGLFAIERKKPLPKYPLHIALVTSRQTAAYHDMLKVLRRFSWLRLMLFDVPVQGEGSAEVIAQALQALGARGEGQGAREDRISLAPRRLPLAPDVILLARGGGSLEDLWEFNEEIVARAIARSQIPIITGIGHEVDISIADLVADYHAHTPTEAAQVVVTHWRTARDALGVLALRMRRELHQTLQHAHNRLEHIERHDIFRRPTHRLNVLRQHLDDQQRRLALAAMRVVRRGQARLTPLEALMIKCHPRNDLQRRRERMDHLSDGLRRGVHSMHQQLTTRLDAMQRTLLALSPQAVLGRGYSITRLKRGGKLVQSTNDVKPGDLLQIQLRDGNLESIVQDQRQGKLFDSQG